MEGLTQMGGPAAQVSSGAAPSGPVAAPSTPGTAPWIFSRRVDLLVFAAPAALSLLLLAALRALSEPSEPSEPSESPEWVWVSAVLLVDVAHVWSTAFVTYLCPAELRRHPERYVAVPALGWVLGVLLYALAGAEVFWRALAYLAVFHFVRQQYGWLMLYRARAGDTSRLGACIDGAAIYAATLYPLVWWHTHLPRHFHWFLPGDFAPGLPAQATTLAGAMYLLCLGAYAVRATLQLGKGPVPWGKHLLVLGTASTWYVGIVACNDDTAFTLTNVLSHGIPYAALVFFYARHVGARERGPSTRLVGGSPAVALGRFVACVWLLAYVEELAWDRGVWHERPFLFGEGLDLEGVQAWLVPLLAVPQITHYALDGLLWRRGGNPHLRDWFRGNARQEEGGGGAA